MHVLVNQLGYEPGERPRAVLRGTGRDDPGDVVLEHARTGDAVARAEPERAGRVDGWRDWVFWAATLPAPEEAGEYVVAVDPGTGDGRVRSRRFQVAADLRRAELLPAILSYFRAERCTGAYDRADREATFVGEREDVVDVRGGWYDASGDVSKYLSHLHYANYLNPQQIPLVVWALLDVADRVDAEEPVGERLARGAREEAHHGADYLVRAQDEAGYFYATVFDEWSGEPDDRRVCAFEGFPAERTADYEAGFRQGGGVAVAALARASDCEGRGEFDDATYRDAAVTGFEHLREHNERYLDDGTENLLDDYCALLAATELAAATGEERFLEAATDRARSLLARQTDEGYFLADDPGDGDGRPFYHAAEEGFPAVALCRYLAVGEDFTAGDSTGTPLAGEVRAALCDYWDFELELTRDVVNPFGYARQYARGVDDAEPRARFFMPHDNETGYWWQGENARLASLAAGALATADALDDPGLAEDLERFAADQRDWILGRNPFDVSMVEGVGRNSEPFFEAAFHTPGGVVNGITAAVDGDGGIAFDPEEYDDEPSMAWRWSEQWLPHAAWLAVALGQEVERTER